jgi:hypothetical protein
MDWFLAFLRSVPEMVGRRGEAAEGDVSPFLLFERRGLDVGDDILCKVVALLEDDVVLFDLRLLKLIFKA